MAKSGFSLVIEDVNGSFAKLIREAPQLVRAELSKAVGETVSGVKDRMVALAPIDPSDPSDDGDMRNFIEARLPRRNGLFGEAGVFNPAQAQIALFNEYSPNHQPFMRPAATGEAGDYLRRAVAALKRAEDSLSRGT